MFDLQASTLNKMELLYEHLKRNGHNKEALVLVRCIAEALGDWSEHAEASAALEEFRTNERGNES